MFFFCGCQASYIKLDRVALNKKVLEFDIRCINFEVIGVESSCECITIRVVCKKCVGKNCFSYRNHSTSTTFPGAGHFIYPLNKNIDVQVAACIGFGNRFKIYLNAIHDYCIQAYVFILKQIREPVIQPKFIDSDHGIPFRINNGDTFHVYAIEPVYVNPFYAGFKARDFGKSFKKAIGKAALNSRYLNNKEGRYYQNQKNV